MPAERDPTLDETDRRLLNALLADGRASMTEVGEAVGVAQTTAVNRLGRLEETGAIAGYEPTLDYAALGYDVTVVFRLDVAGDGLQRVVERLAASRQMVDVYEVTGSHDVVAVGKFTDLDDMNAWVADLAADERVRAVTTNVVRDVVHEHEQFPLDAE